jgi:hypothetical protein
LPYLLLKRDLEVIVADTGAQRDSKRFEQLPQTAEMPVSV